VKEKVLNLEELADEILRIEYPTYENTPLGMRNALIKKKRMIKEVLKQHLKCVCKFYLKYKDMPELLLAGHPELADAEIRHRTTIREFAEHHNNDVDEVWLNLNDFNEWLFRYVFKEVITEDVEKEVNDEQWKFIRLLEVMSRE